jgi:hypothetical protein
VLAPAEAVIVTICCAAVTPATTWKPTLVWPAFATTLPGAVTIGLLVLIVTGRGAAGTP